MNLRSNVPSLAAVALAIAGSLLCPFTARALLLTWQVDSSASYLRLTVPDQNVYVTNNNIGNITARMRDPSDNNNWTDAGGRRASIDGTFTTLYQDGTSITFLAGSNTLVGLEQVNLRPNPADWDPASLSYTNTRTAPAALGARVRGTYAAFFTFDIAFFTMRNVHFDVGGPTLPISGGSFPGGQTPLGISSASSDVDGLELPLSLGQPVPDLLGAAMSPIIATNTLGGTITNVTGSSRKLTVNISMPVSIDIQGTILNGSAAGVIVATATLPQPPPLRIAQGANHTVILSWPASVTGFVLEQNPDLAASNWTTVGTASVVVGNEQQVTLPASAGPAFYRLRSL